jgi:uncharacterized membrane protein YfcA
MLPTALGCLGGLGGLHSGGIRLVRGARLGPGQFVIGAGNHAGWTRSASVDWRYLWLALAGFGVGIAASFVGLGGGFLLVPLLLLLGYEAQKAIGTSFLAILIISISALIAHNRLANVDYRVGAVLGIGGIIGAQIGARLVENVSTSDFRRIFALVLVGLAGYLFFQK